MNSVYLQIHKYGILYLFIYLHMSLILIDSTECASGLGVKSGYLVEICEVKT